MDECGREKEGAEGGDVEGKEEKSYMERRGEEERSGVMEGWMREGGTGDGCTESWRSGDE